MIPLFNPKPRLKDIWAVAKQMRSGQIGPGAKVEQFEQALCDYTGVNYCLCTNSGTSALMLAVMAVGLPKDKPIYIPAYSMPAAANVAKFLGYEVELVDNGEPCTIDVAMNGHSNDVSADILDASQWFGARSSRTVYSFAPQKLITTGQGGAFLTEVRSDYVRATRLRNQGILDDLTPTYGLNLRMSDVQAAWGLSQMEDIGETKAKIDLIMDWYIDNCVEFADGGQWLAFARVYDPDKFVLDMKQRGVETSRLYKPLYMLPEYKTSKSFPEAKEIYDHTVYLPSWVGLKERQVKQICQAIKDVS